MNAQLKNIGLSPRKAPVAGKRMEGVGTDSGTDWFVAACGQYNSNVRRGDPVVRLDSLLCKW
jgi:hypothetical protein